MRGRVGVFPTRLFRPEPTVILSRRLPPDWTVARRPRTVASASEVYVDSSWRRVNPLLTSKARGSFLWIAPFCLGYRAVDLYILDVDEFAVYNRRIYAQPMNKVSTRRVLRLTYRDNHERWSHVVGIGR